MKRYIRRKKFPWSKKVGKYLYSNLSKKFKMQSTEKLCCVTLSKLPNLSGSVRL